MCSSHNDNSIVACSNCEDSGIVIVSPWYGPVTCGCTTGRAAKKANPEWKTDTESLVAAQADELTYLVHALTAIRARIAGEWDTPSLALFNSKLKDDANYCLRANNHNSLSLDIDFIAKTALEGE